MRDFNKEEQGILKLLVNRYRITISRKIVEPIKVRDIFEELAKEIEIVIAVDIKEKKIQIRSEKLIKLYKEAGSNYAEEEPIKQQFTQSYTIQYKTSLILSLLDYLEKNHLIYLALIMPEHKKRYSITLNDDLVFKDDHAFVSYFVASTINDFLFENLEKSIFPTPELIDFVENGFKDKEQIRYEENVKLQRDSLEQANRSTTAATKLGWISTIIAFFSFVAAVASLMPESRRQQWFGITKNDEPVERRLKANHPDTVISKQKQIINKKSLSSDILKSKSISTDSLKSK